jgi:hypothetical protein
MITAAELARRLADLPTANTPAVQLFLELMIETDVESVVARREEIEATCEGLERQIESAKGIAERCQRLPSVPSKQIPTGF